MGLFDEISGTLGSVFSDLSEIDKNVIFYITSPFTLLKLLKKPDIWMASYLLQFTYSMYITRYNHLTPSKTVKQEILKKVFGNTDGIRLYKEIISKIQNPSEEMDDGCRSAVKDFKEWIEQGKEEGPKRWYKYMVK